MRIVGGQFRGRTLIGPKGTETRPTSDRVRESIFNILTHGSTGLELQDARVLDLFAGTGALGLEAISRGAKFCQFVDDSAEARGTIRQNADALGIIGLCKIWKRDATNLGSCAPQSPYDLVFADPPYNKGLGTKALQAVVEGGWIVPGSIIVLEESEKAVVPELFRLEMLDQRTYGDTNIMFYRATSRASSPVLLPP
jgi:16S rRNA (guanine966-N2)-methyltransferase